MKLRSSRLQGESSDGQSKQSAVKNDITSATSTRKDFKSKSESDTSSSPSNVQSIPPLSRPEPARRYNLRSRSEILSKALSKHQKALSEHAKLKIQKVTKRRTGFRASATGGPRTCPICVESRPRYLSKNDPFRFAC